MLNHGQVVPLIFGMKLRELRQKRGPSVRVGFRGGDNQRSQVCFLAEPARPFRIVNNTCERFPIPDSEWREAAPIEILRQAERAAFETVVAKLAQAG